MNIIKTSIFILIILSIVGCKEGTGVKNRSTLTEVTPEGAPHMLCVYRRPGGGLQCFRKEPTQ